MRRLLSPQTAISLVVLAGLLVLLLTNFDIEWSATWDHMRSLNPWWYALAFVVYYSSFIFRGARWRILLMNAAAGDDPPTPAPSVIYCARIVHMSWFANTVTFFRVGDAFRAFAYSEDFHASFPRTVGTVLADRLIDLTLVILIMVLGISILLLQGDVDPPLLLVAVAAALLGLIVAGLVGMFVARRWMLRWLPARLAHFYERFHEGTMGSFGRFPLVFALGVLGWVAEIGRLFFVVQALGVSVAVGLLVFVPMANGLLSAVPLTPGGLGVVETGVSGLLQLELTVELAVAVALVDRSLTYLSVVFTGGISFALRQLGGKRRAAADAGTA
jgi:uncharacterized membrane protein YbhN (UPF0104 family)